MTAVGLWVKQLVLMVLLAVFADMLLPTKSMQRYVRLVLGLAVIAVMVKPVLPLFRQDWATQVASQLANEFTANTTAGNTQTPDLQRFTDTIRHQQQDGADAALAAQLTTQVSDSFHVQVRQLTVSGASLTDPNLSAAVVLSTNSLPSASTVNRVQTYVATQLGVPLDRVHVRLE